ncbi:MAG: hypothetical protein ROM54_11790, partial [Anaerobiospirillum sp.]|nr:hypothetical protein [Anaerobiospirillum sp.]
HPNDNFRLMYPELWKKHYGEDVPEYVLTKLNDELKEKVAQAVKRGPGRPKGSKNKKTLEREQAEAAAKKQEEKRGPGRPKGSKNKATLEREQAEAAAKKQEEKRGPGRPKGSKNKKTLEREQAEAAAKKQEEKRGPRSESPRWNQGYPREA